MSRIQSNINLSHETSGSDVTNAISRISSEDDFRIESIDLSTSGVVLTPTFIITPREYLVRNLSGDSMLVSLDAESSYPLAIPVGEAVLFSLDVDGASETSTIVAELDVEGDQAGLYFDLTDRSTFAARVWFNTTATTEVTTISTVADVADSLDGTSFILQDAAGSVGVWIDTDDSGTTIPAAANAADRAIEITTIATGAIASAVATLIKTALDNDAAFSASTVSNTMTITDASTGTRTAASDSAGGEATGFTVTRATQGHTAPSAPATPASGRLLPVTTTINATAIENAVAIAAALDADAEFIAAVPTTSLVTVVDQHAGTRTNIVDGDTTYTLATTNEGSVLPVVYGKSKGTSQAHVMVVPH
jgi:hypothetical protein